MNIHTIFDKPFIKLILSFKIRENTFNLIYNKNVEFFLISKRKYRQKWKHTIKLSNQTRQSKIGGRISLKTKEAAVDGGRRRRESTLWKRVGWGGGDKLTWHDNLQILWGPPY